MAFPIGRFKQRHTAATIVTLALVVRTAFALFSPGSMLSNPRDDPDSYARFARVLATSGTFGPAADQPSAYRPPGYPILLAPWCYEDPPRVWGIFLVHLVLSAGIVGFTWILSHQAGATTFAWIACALAAVDPLLVHHSTLIMSETLFTFLFVALLTLWLRGIPPIGSIERRPRMRGPGRFHAIKDLAMRMPGKSSIPVSDVDVNTVAFYQSPPASRLRKTAQWGAAGIVLGAAILVRPVAAAFWGLLLLPALFQKRTGDWLATTAVAAALCLPWVVRNFDRFGEFIPTTTHGGYTLWLGQNPDYYRTVVDGPHALWPEEDFRRWTEANAEETAGMTETQRDRHFRDRAISWMKDRPAEALRTVGHHVASLWSPIPNTGPVELRRACLIFHVLVFLTAAAGLLNRWIWTTDLIALPLALVSFTLVHALFWSDMRMRAPLAPILAVLAAATVQSLFPTRPKRNPSKLPWR